MPIQRITLFRIVDDANIEPMLNAYRELEATAVKDGKPYILELKARRVHPEVQDRSKGYTFVAMSRFKGIEDMRYYDEECEAHKKLKMVGRDMVEQPWQPPLTTFFEDE